MAIDATSMKKRLKNKKANPKTFREWVENSERSENCDSKTLNAHIWDKVNEHLGTAAFSVPDLIQQLSVMRFGRRSKVCDPFCGSGQIPFEAARMGCDVYASDLNPVACMLTWGSFHIVGASEKKRGDLLEASTKFIRKIEDEMEALGFESDGKGRKAKTYLYCCECTCPITGWKVPIMPSFIISNKQNVFVRLIPDAKRRRYEIEIVSDGSDKEMKNAKKGTLQEGRLIHPQLEDISQAKKISSIRDNGQNPLRRWKKADIVFREDDIFQERLYCVQWQNKDGSTEFSAITKKVLEREEAVIDYVSSHLAQWQKKGGFPTTRSRLEPKQMSPFELGAGRTGIISSIQGN